MVRDIYTKIEPMLKKFETLTSSLNDVRKVIKNTPLEKMFTEEYASKVLSQEDLVLQIKDTKNIINTTIIAYFEDIKKQNPNAEELNDLIDNLLKILKGKDRKEEDYVIVSDIFCVSSSFAKRVEVLFDKIDIAYKKTSHKPEEPKPKPNIETITKITEQLEYIRDLSNNTNITKQASDGTSIALEYYFEYENLLTIKNCLENAPENINKDLAPGELYLRDSDKEKVTELVALTEFFGGISIRKTEIAANIKEIKRLEEYKKDLEIKYNRAKNFANLKSGPAHDGTMLLEDDILEYDIICTIIDILKDIDIDMENVWNIGFVKRSNIPIFKEYVNNSTFYEELVPKIPQNEEIIKDIINRINEMVDAAKLAKEDSILASDKEEYNLLIEQYAYLKNAQAAMNLVEVEGALINDVNAPMYAAIVKQKKDLLAKKGKKPDAKNEKDTGHQVLPPALPPQEKKKKEPATKPKRKKILKVRELNIKNKIKITKNWRKIFGIGLALIIVALAISELAPMLIYANCCNAIAMPAYSTVFNTINEGLALFTKFSIADINMSAAAANTFSSYMASLIPLATASGGLVLANGLVKEDDILRVPSPSIRQKIYDKIMSVTASPRKILKNAKNTIETNYLKLQNNKNDHFKYFVEGILKSWAPKLDEEQVIQAKVQESLEASAVSADNMPRQVSNYKADISPIDNLTSDNVYHPNPKPEEKTKFSSIEETEAIANPATFIAENVKKYMPEEKLEPVNTNVGDIYNAFILNEVNTYQEKVQKGESVKQIRDFIFSKTAVDLNEYSLEDFDLVKMAIIRILSLDNLGLAMHFEQKIKSLQETLDELELNKDYLKNMEALASENTTLEEEFIKIKDYFNEISPDLLIKSLKEDIESLNNTLDSIRNKRER